MGPGKYSGEEVFPGPLPWCFLRMCQDLLMQGLCSTGSQGASNYGGLQSLARGRLVNQASKHPARKSS